MKTKKINECLNRFHVAIPKPRDQKERPSCIPQAVLEAKAKHAAEKEKSKTEKDLEDENGGAGVYSASLKKNYILVNDEWKDMMPEILDGHNVYDFVDPDILLGLEELEREEGLREEELEDDDFEMDGKDLTLEEQEALAEIRKRKSLLIQQHRINKSTAESRPIVPRKFDKDKKFTTKRMGKQLSALGLNPSKAIDRARSKSRGCKRERSVDRGDDYNADAMDMDMDQPNKKLRLRSISWPRSRSRSRPPSEVIPGEGFKDSAQKVKLIKLGKKFVMQRNKNARRGEADRVFPNLKPKHLFSGKRSVGETDRR